MAAIKKTKLRPGGGERGGAGGGSISSTTKRAARNQNYQNYLKNLEKSAKNARAVKKTTKDVKFAIKNEAKTGSRDSMVALKKSGRPTSWSKTTNTVTSPMGILKKGGKPTAAQKGALNKMRQVKK